MKQAYYTSGRVWNLPPLILHPFSDAASPRKLLQSSRANLMLQGVLPKEEHSVEQLEEMILDGRMCEVRMLFYVGKDLLRWSEQCTDFVASEPELRSCGIELQTFVSLLVDDAPPRIKEKLSGWGVQDYRAIFSRAVGLNAVFADVPDRLHLAAEFIRNYHYYADRMYDCWSNSRAFAKILTEEFEFELYASGEYSRILEKQWESEA
jgi:hypothetical protein